MPEFMRKYKNLMDTIIFILVWGLVFWFLPLLALFGFRGAESAYNQSLVSLYWGLGSVVMILLIAGRVNQYFATKNPQYGKKMGWYGSLVNNTEMSMLAWDRKRELPKWLQGFKSGFKQFWFSIIIFSLTGIFAVVKNTFLIDYQQIAQQILPLGAAILAIEPSGVEILGLVFLVGLNMYIWRWVQDKKGFSNEVYWAIAIPTSWIVGILFYGLPLHFFAYPTSDKDLIGVAGFWLLATTLILLFGSYVLVWVLKDVHNLFDFMNDQSIKSKTLYSDEKIVVIAAIVLGLMVLATISYILIRHARKKALRNVSSS